MTRRKRWRPPWSWQFAGVCVALVVLGFAADGLGRLLIAAGGIVGGR